MTNTLKKITRDFDVLLHEGVVTSEDQQREVKKSKREEKVMASNNLVKRESEMRGFGEMTSRGENTTSEADNILDPAVRSTINFSFDYNSLIWAIFSWQSWLVFLGVVTTVKHPAFSSAHTYQQTTFAVGICRRHFATAAPDPPSQPVLAQVGFQVRKLPWEV